MGIISISYCLPVTQEGSTSRINIGYKMRVICLIGIAFVASVAGDALKLSDRCTAFGELLGDPHNSCQYVECTYGDEPWVDPKTGAIALFELTRKCPKGAANDLKNFNAAHPCNLFSDVCVKPLKPVCKADGQFLPDTKDVCKYKRCAVAEEPWIDPKTGLQLIRLVQIESLCPPGTKNDIPEKFNAAHPCALWSDGTDCATPHPTVIVPHVHPVPHVPVKVPHVPVKVPHVPVKVPVKVPHVPIVKVPHVPVVKVPHVPVVKVPHVPVVKVPHVPLH